MKVLAVGARLGGAVRVAVAVGVAGVAGFVAGFVAGVVAGVVAGIVAGIVAGVVAGVGGGFVGGRVGNAAMLSLHSSFVCVPTLLLFFPPAALVFSRVLVAGILVFQEELVLDQHELQKHYR